MISSDIIRGHLDAIILRLIIEKDRYGYEISKEISKRTNNEQLPIYFHERSSCVLV